MMRWLVALTCISLMFHEVSSAGYVFPMKTKVIGKFRTWVCNWLTAAQYTTLIDGLEPQLSENTKVEDLQPMLISGAMAVTTFGQKLTIAGVGAKMLSKGDITVPIGIFAGALANNVQAFANQIIEMYVEYLDQGQTKQRVFQRAYKMIDMFMTQKRVATIYCRIRKTFDRVDPAWWPFLKTTLNGIVFYSALDGLKPVGVCN